MGGSARVEAPPPPLNLHDSLLHNIKQGVQLKPKEEQSERKPKGEKLDMLSELTKSLDNRRSGMQKDSERLDSASPSRPKPQSAEDFARSKITGLRQYLDEHQDEEDDEEDWDD
jgi:hypothetical protein